MQCERGLLRGWGYVRRGNGGALPRKKDPTGDSVEDNS